MPLVLVPDIGGLDRVGSGIDAQDQVDDVLERGVGHVRHVPAAEADVVADTLHRNALERVVQGVDPQVGPAPVFLRVLGNEKVIHVREDSVIDLDEETGLVDGLILLLQRFGDGVNVLLLAGVVLVDAVVGGALDMVVSDRQSIDEERGDARVAAEARQ